MWKGKEQKAKGAKVSWERICYPKSERGLGIKELFCWNKACILQHIWAIITQAGSLWTAWLQAYVLREGSFWQLTPSQGSRWSWKKLLDLRIMAFEFKEWEGEIGRWKISGQKYKVSDVWRVI